MWALENSIKTVFLYIPLLALVCLVEPLPYVPPVGHLPDGVHVVRAWRGKNQIQNFAILFTTQFWEKTQGYKKSN